MLAVTLKAAKVSFSALVEVAIKGEFERNRAPSRDIAVRRQPNRAATRHCHQHNNGVTTSSIPSAAVIGADGRPTTKTPSRRPNPPITTNSVSTRTTGP